MTTSEKVEQLFSRINSAPTDSKLILEKLYDEGSFVEVGYFNDCSVVTGYGVINGELVYAYCQSGAINAEHSKKIARIYELALEVGSPIIGILDSEGTELDEISDCFENYGALLSNQSKASGVIPQIAILKGDCIGMSSFIPALSDFTFMIDKTKMFMSSPATFKGLDGKSLTYDSLGGSEACAKKGTISASFSNIDDCIKDVRELVSFLPSNNIDEDLSATADDLNREDEKLNSVVVDESSELDVEYIIKSISDKNEFIEIKKLYAPTIVTGFAKFDGMTTGVIANKGLITAESAEKASSFVKFCDSFNIPVLTLTDVAGYEKSAVEEQKGIIKNSAKLVSAFVDATVPKINVIIRNAIGSSYLLMNSKYTGADIVYAWPTAEIAGIDKTSAVKLFDISEEDYDEAVSPYHYAKKGQVDDIILPAATRKRVIAALEMLFSKRIITPDKKHNSI